MSIISLLKIDRAQVPVVGLTVSHLVYLTILFYKRKNGLKLFHKGIF